MNSITQELSLTDLIRLFTAELEAEIGCEKIRLALKDREFFCNDVFFWNEVRIPDVVIQPTQRADVAAVVKLAQRIGIAINLRGGGMSYTKGYLQEGGPSVLIDLSKLDSVIEINPTARYAIVEAGCTWLKLMRSTADYGLVPSLVSPPMSGSHSTVGGAASQNLPGTMAGILGLEVVTGDGQFVRTGSWGRNGAASPFYRNFGPDITGLFLGDCGAFGVKTAVVVHLRRKPKALGYGSFAFRSYEDLAATMIELSQIDSVVTRLGLDPYESRTAPQVAWKQGIKTLSEVARTGTSLLSGITESMKMALIGRDFMADAGWTLHIKSEGVNQAAAEDSIDEARRVIMQRAIKELPPILLRAAEATGPSVRKFLGKNGERWVATNSMYEIGRAVEVASKVQQFFSRWETEIVKHGVTVSYVTSCSQFHFMCEPCFTWKDEVSELHLGALLPEEAERFRNIAPNIEARKFVQHLREEFRDFAHDLGAVHVQFAKFYPFQEALLPATRDLLQRLKALLDPNHNFSPGNLGFEPKAAVQ